MSTAARLRTDRAQLALGPPGRWQPRSLRAATVSTSDARMPDVGRVDADPLLVRLGRVAARRCGPDRSASFRDRVVSADGDIRPGDPLADVTQVAAIGL